MKFLYLVSRILLGKGGTILVLPTGHGSPAKLFTEGEHFVNNLCYFRAVGRILKKGVGGGGSFKVDL